MTAFLRFLDGHVFRWFLIGTHTYFCLIILVEVVRRYVFGASSAWGEMSARYAFVYLIYVAAAEGIHRGRHIRIDLLPNSLPPRLRMLLELYVDTLTIVLAGCVIYYALEVMEIQWTAGIVMTAADINMAFAQAALPIGWSLIIIRIVQSWMDRNSTRWSAPTVYESD